MNTFINILEKHNLGSCLDRGELTTLQVNTGNLCNQQCAHCHINASPEGKNIMSKKVIDDILRFLVNYKMQVLDITGGAPELNPNFDYLITSARPLVDEIIVRSNLTVIFEPGKEYLPDFFKNNKIHLICSLPCYQEENVDNQRGPGVFRKSIEALRLLNAKGYSRDNNLQLDLVYNPAGANLPPDQEQLQSEYKDRLKQQNNIEFNRLITITNVPINRFKDYLESRNEYDKYYHLLEDNFNPLVIDGLMCRSFLSVGIDGNLYDCDFNQALGLALKDKKGSLITIDKLNPEHLKGREIALGAHCLSCTAGYGSSCQGVLSFNNKCEKSVQEIIPASDDNMTKDSVKDYYGKILRQTKDLKTNACCAGDSLPREFKNILNRIEPEILKRFYGCGSPIPPAIEGCTVLDLGCGTGRDVYLASYLAGEQGFIIGVDMTDEQLDIARKHKDKQMEEFGFKSGNVDFRKGYIEDLKEIEISDNSIDVVISNCVINLSPDKEKVFTEIFRVLKTGGELYFSDVFADRRIPQDIKNDPVLYGECLGGALYIEDFRRILRQVGCLDYRIVSQTPITINNPELETKIGMINFFSMTIRAFNLPGQEDICEDYGQSAVYSGKIPYHPHKFILDGHHIFTTGKPMLICGNTASMLQDTRYAKHFNISGDRHTHFGSFDCSSDSIDKTKPNCDSTGCC